MTANVCALVPSDADVAAAPVYGALVSLVAAGEALEVACHAATVADATAALDDCAVRLRWAQADLELVDAEDLRDLAACAATTVEDVAATGPGGLALGDWQVQVLTPLHAQIVSVVSWPVQQWLAAQRSLAADANLAFLSVLGFAVGLIGVAGYINGKQRRGGYRRGPVGVPHEIVSYTYPRGAARTRPPQGAPVKASGRARERRGGGETYTLTDAYGHVWEAEVHLISSTPHGGRFSGVIRRDGRIVDRVEELGLPGHRRPSRAVAMEMLGDLTEPYDLAVGGAGLEDAVWQPGDLTSDERANLDGALHWARAPAPPSAYGLSRRRR